MNVLGIQQTAFRDHLLTVSNREISGLTFATRTALLRIFCQLLLLLFMTVRGSTTCVREKWKMSVVREGLQKAALLYGNNVEREDDALDITRLEDEAPRLVEPLEHEKEEQERLHDRKYMPFDVEKSDKNGGEQDPVATPGTSGALRSTTKKDAVGPRKDESKRLCLVVVLNAWKWKG